ncbi:MAG: hypothetical protein P8X74_11760 [Reinekea sp.]
MLAGKTAPFQGGYNIALVVNHNWFAERFVAQMLGYPSIVSQYGRANIIADAVLCFRFCIGAFGNYY